MDTILLLPSYLFQFHQNQKERSKGSYHKTFFSFFFLSFFPSSSSSVSFLFPSSFFLFLLIFRFISFYSFCFFVFFYFPFIFVFFLPLTSFEQQCKKKLPAVSRGTYTHTGNYFLKKSPFFFFLLFAPIISMFIQAHLTLILHN